MTIKTSFWSVLIFSVIAGLVVSCNVLEKGYTSLAEYDYFQAKQKFEKSLKKNTSPAAFGLSQIYGRTDNPFSNLDSAYHYSLLSVESYLQLKEKQKIEYRRDLGLSLRRMELWREEISVRYFKIARERNTSPAYIEFYSNHPWSSLKDSAIYLSDSLSFENALKQNKTTAYLYFLKHYEESVFADQVRHKLEESQYSETVVEGDILSFERFLEIYPSNFLTEKAHRNIYELSTIESTERSYANFLKKYPESPYVNEAWLNLYRITTSDYTKETINQFDEKYPNFPFHDLILSDLELVSMNLLPYKLNNMFGYMDDTGLPVIPPSFEFAGIFSNGLAVVSKDNVYGFIDKNKDLVIDYLFEDASDFDQGRAVVEVDGLLGLIDRSGKYIVEPAYDDIGPLSNGLLYALKDDKYGYFDKYGYNRIPFKFDEAFSFSNGLAKVIHNGHTQLIDTDGGVVLNVKNADIRMFNDSLYIYEVRDSMNLISLSGNFILDRFVDRIGSLSENRALIEKGGKYGYINKFGEEIIPVKFIVFPNVSQFSSFKNGHVRTKKGDFFGLIDSLGQQVFPALFDNIGDFGELTPVTKGKAWGYADKKVKLHIPYRFDYAFPFINGRAIVVMNNLYGVINLDGSWKVEPMYQDLKKLNEDIYMVQENELFGLINSDGKVIIPTIYRRVMTVNNDLLQFEGENELDYFIVSKRKMITLLKENE